MAKGPGGTSKPYTPDGPRALLKGAGLRVTAVRVNVYSYLLQQGRPLSHQEITARLRRHDRVTLYRTLNRLKAAGLVHAVQGLEGAWRFCAHRPEHSGCPGNHPHFLCLSCGRMICLPDQKLPYVYAPPEMEVKGKQLLVYGRCASCIRSSRSPAPGRPEDAPGRRSE